jgi:hypothetical protein
VREVGVLVRHDAVTSFLVIPAEAGIHVERPE